tara:strand:+ start:72 stop:488 length:417 start_codon:yes stop_codon:yes gene_type:complete
MNNNSIPPYVESIFHEVLGARNARIADFKITAARGTPNPKDTTETLKEILNDLASVENQLEVLVGMFPNLEKILPKPPPQNLDSPQKPTQQPTQKTPSNKVSEAALNMKKEDIEGDDTNLYEDGKVISNFKPSDLKES